MGRSTVMFTGLALGTALVGCADPCGASGTTCTVLGTGSPGNDRTTDVAVESPLYGPMDVAAWGDATRFFVGDWNNHAIKLVEGATVRTVIGTEFLGDGDPTFQERIPPGIDGTKVALNHPTQIEWSDEHQRLLVPSWHNHRVREWNPETGNSLVVCADTDITDGNGANAGFAGDGGPAADALFAFPQSIAVDDASGDFWIVDSRNMRIRRVAADYSLIDTIAGNGEQDYTGDDGPALDGSFHFWDRSDLQPEPAGAIEFDGDHTLYIADVLNHAIRVVDLEAGTIATVPGTGTHTGGPLDPCDQSTLCMPRDVELGPDGLLYVADEGNHVIRSIDPETGDMQTVAGTFEQGDGDDGLAPTETALDRPYGLDVTDDGTILIADTYNHRIRKVIP